MQMFLWDFVADKVMGQIIDWAYEQLLEFLGEFFGMMGNMGAELFSYDFVEAVVEIFRLFGWTLFLTGLVVAVFAVAIQYQSGRGSVRDASLNAVKGFMAVSLFTVAGQFGLDTSTRGNIMSAVYAAQSAVSITRTIVNTVK